MTKQSHNLIKTFVGIAGLGLCAQAQAAVLFADNFNRPNSGDLNASTDGKSGTLGALDWIQLGSVGSMEIDNNQLRGGDDLAGGGWSMSYLDHNFVDSAITDAGGFNITIDLVNYATSGATRHMGIAMGMSETDAAGWSHNNPNNLDYVDLFAGYRGNQSAIQVFESSDMVIDNTGAGGPGTLPKTLQVDFLFSSFDAGSPVDYVVTFGGDEMGTGSFNWSGTDENYIGVYNNLSNNQGVMDNFAITPIPEPTALSLVLLGALATLRRRR